MCDTHESVENKEEPIVETNNVDSEPTIEIKQSNNDSDDKPKEPINIIINISMKRDDTILILTMFFIALAGIFYSYYYT